MRHEESSYPQDWFRVGNKELNRARYLLNGGDLDGTGFNIQQAVEKYLKGYLLSSILRSTTPSASSGQGRMNWREKTQEIPHN